MWVTTFPAQSVAVQTRVMVPSQVSGSGASVSDSKVTVGASSQLSEAVRVAASGTLSHSTVSSGGGLSKLGAYGERRQAKASLSKQAEEI